MVRYTTSLHRIAVALLLCLLAAAAHGAPVACDVNGSGEIDASDVQLVINAALSITVPYNTNVDYDSQGLTTAIDVQLVINAALSIPVDSDGDGLTDAAEANLGTNPNLADTDGGGVDDGTEVMINHTNPNNAADDGTSTPPTADFTAAPVTGSYPLDVQFTDASTNGSSTITHWLWGFGDGGTSTLQSPLHTYTQQGTYNVSLTVTSAAGQDSIVKNSLVTVTQPAQPQVHWVSLQDGYWDDPNNWSTGQVPNAQQLAVVDLPSQNITVTIRQGTTVYNADIKENLTIIGGGTLYEYGKATISGTLSITGGGTLQVDGSGATFTANGPVSLPAPHIVTRNGGVASFPTLTTFSYTTNANPTLFDSSGTGSLIDLSHLTNFTFNNGLGTGITADITVASNGVIDLSALTTVNLGTNHHYEFDVSSGGAINADLLQTNSGFNAYTGSGGSLSMPGLAALTNTYIHGTGAFTAANALTAANATLDLSGGSFSAGNLATLSGSSVSIYGSAAVTLPALTALTDTAVSMSNTASLTLPALTGMTSTTSKTLYVSDTAQFSAPNLTGLTNIVVQVRNGAVLSLPITTYLWNYNVNPTVFDVSGTGSQLSFPNLTSLTFNNGIASGIRMYWSASNNGTLTVPALATVTLGTNHKYELDAYSGGTISANSLTSNSGLYLTTTSPSTLTLPGLTSLSGVSIGGSGNVVLPNATTAPGLAIGISGGSVTANGLTTITGGSLSVSGTASMSLPNVTSLVDTSIDIENSAILSLPALTSMSSTTSKTIYIINSTATFTAPNLATLSNIVIQLRNGAVLSLPFSTYTWTYNVNPTVFDVSGAGSQLTLPNLTAMTFDNGLSTNIRMYLSAANGGALNLPLLTAVALGANHQYEIDAATGGSVTANSLASNTGLHLYTSTPSTLSLPGLTNISNVGITGTGALTLANATNGSGISLSINGGSFVANNLNTVAGGSLTTYGTSTVTLPGLTTLTNTDLDVEDSSTLSMPNVTSMTSTTSKRIYMAGAGASLSMPLLASATNIAVQLRSGAVLSLPITSYTWNYNANPTSLDISGTNSHLTLPNLTGITFNNGLSSSIRMYLSGANGGALTLPALTSVTLGTNHSFELDATNGGSITADVLATSGRATFNTATPSTLSLPGLTSLSGATVMGTGAFTFANVTAASGLTISTTAGSITANSLAAITGNSALTLTGTASMNLPALTTLTDTTFDVENTASLTLPALASITSSTSKTMYVSNSATVTAGALTSVTNLAFQVRNGAHLTLPITSYTWNLNANPTGFDVSGVGSQLNLTALTALSFNDGISSNITFYVAASAGSSINIASLATVGLGTNHHMDITANGAGANIAITALNPLPANVTTSALNGGTIS